MGWYDLQIASYNPLEYLNSDADTTTPQSKEFILNGIADFQTEGLARNGKLISLRLEQFGADKDHNPGVDYYVGYNRNAFPNDGVTHGINQVILYSKDESIESLALRVSRRVAMLQEGDSYTIADYKGIVNATVVITVDSISEDWKDAVVRITTTPPPLPCDGVGRFKVEIGIDFPRENHWKLFEQNTTTLVEEGMAQELYKRQVYVEPAEDGTFYCLTPGSCYDFTIYDLFGDGFIANKGGYYSGILDNTVLFNSSKFTDNYTQPVCVEGNDDDIPTLPPTAECLDDDTLRYTYKNKSRNCNWVGKKTSKRCELVSSQQNKLLKEFCPSTCGLCESTTITEAPTQLPTEAPTRAPSATPTTTDDNNNCVDDAVFRYKGVKHCGKWMAADLTKRCHLNAQAGHDADTNQPLLISDFCRLTCIEFTTKCQSTTPTTPPTPTTGDGDDDDDDNDDSDDTSCVDNDDFKYKGKDSKNCVWLGNNGSKKKGKKRCRSTLEDGTSISDACPSTCGLKFGVGKCKPK